MTAGLRLASRISRVAMRVASGIAGLTPDSVESELRKFRINGYGVFKPSGGNVWASQPLDFPDSLPNVVVTIMDGGKSVQVKLECPNDAVKDVVGEHESKQDGIVGMAEELSVIKGILAKMVAGLEHVAEKQKKQEDAEEGGGDEGDEDEDAGLDLDEDEGEGDEGDEEE